MTEIIQINDEETRQHTRIEYELGNLASIFGFKFHIARNDRNQLCDEKSFRSLKGYSDDLSHTTNNKNTIKTIELIDEIWTKSGIPKYAFEVENSTNIRDGIGRLTDLLKANQDTTIIPVIVYPDERKHEVIKELERPRYIDILDKIRLLSYSNFTNEIERASIYLKMIEPKLFMEHLLETYEKFVTNKYIKENPKLPEPKVSLPEVPSIIEPPNIGHIIIEPPKQLKKLYHYNTNSQHCIEMFEYFVNNNVLMIWENPEQKEMIVEKINEGDIFVVYRKMIGYVGIAKILTNARKSEKSHVKTTFNEYIFDIEWIRKPNENILNFKELPFVYQTTCCNIRKQNLINKLEEHFDIDFSEYEIENLSENEYVNNYIQHRNRRDLEIIDASQDAIHITDDIEVKIGKSKSSVSFSMLNKLEIHDKILSKKEDIKNKYNVDIHGTRTGKSYPNGYNPISVDLRNKSTEEETFANIDKHIEIFKQIYTEYK